MSHPMKKISFGLLAVIALLTALWLDFYLPEKSVTTITGVEVKRVDKDGPISKTNPADSPTTDVYYIYTAHDDSQVRVFRNEDTGWHWPYYFKFNSADVQARAKTLEFDKKLARITSYGWRITMLSHFPNVVKVEPVDSADVSTWSLVRWIGFLLWAGLFGFLGWRLYSWFEKREIEGR